MKRGATSGDHLDFQRWAEFDMVILVHWRTAQDQFSQHCRRSHYFTIVFGPLEIAIYGILPFRHGRIAGISVSLPCWLSRLIPFGTSGADHAKHCSWSTTPNVFGQLFCSDDLVVSGVQVKDRNTVKRLNLSPITTSENDPPGNKAQHVIGIFGRYLGQTVPACALPCGCEDTYGDGDRWYASSRWNNVQHYSKMEPNSWLLSPLFGVELIWNTSCFSGTMIGRQCLHSLLVQPPWVVGTIIFVVGYIWYIVNLHGCWVIFPCVD
jgi:hypothetical protein